MDDGNIEDAESARKAKERERGRQYYLANRDKVLKRTREYAKANPDKKAAAQRRRRARKPDHFRQLARRQYARSRLVPSQRMRKSASEARRRAKQRSLPYEQPALSPFIANPPVTCECCGAALNYTSTPNKFSPSVDRIDNSLGYVVGNVAVICWHCNLIKNCGTLDQIEAIAAYMRRHLSASAATSQDVALDPEPQWIFRGKNLGRFPEIVKRGEVFNE